MKRRLLAVRPVSKNYSAGYDVKFAGSFAEAERMMSVEYFDVLDLPADNEKRLFDFLKRYKGNFAVCIHGEDDTDKFIELRDKIRDMGFEFWD